VAGSCAGVASAADVAAVAAAAGAAGAGGCGFGLGRGFGFGCVAAGAAFGGGAGGGGANSATLTGGDSGADSFIGSPRWPLAQPMASKCVKTDNARMSSQRQERRCGRGCMTDMPLV
jgi:hypothetical protein